MKLFWSKTPGRFVNKHTGIMSGARKNPSPIFSTDNQYWYDSVKESIVELMEGKSVNEIECGTDAYDFLTRKIKSPINGASFVCHGYLAPNVVAINGNELVILD